MRNILVTNIIKKASIVLISLILYFFMLESFFRFFPKYGISYFRVANYPQMDHFIVSRILPYEVMRNYTGHISTNSLGMRDKEYSVEKPEGVFRILCLGDSITMYGKYTEFLEDELNKLYPGEFEVWNCGIGGQNLKEYETYLRRRCIRYNPDMVVIGLDITDDFVPARVIFKSKGGRTNCYRPIKLIDFPVDNWLYCHSYFYRFIMVRLENYAVYGHKDELGQKELLARTYLGKIQDIAKKNNISVLTVVFPYLKPDSEETIDFKVANSVLDELKIDRIDLHEYFLKEKRIDLRLNKEDHCHPNQAGDKIAAEAIFDYICRKINVNRK